MKRIWMLGLALIPGFALTQEQEITMSHIKYCYGLWGSAVLCEHRSAWITKSDYIQIQFICDALVEKKYGMIPIEVKQIGRQAAYDAGSELFYSEHFDSRCSLIKLQITNMIEKTK